MTSEPAEPLLSNEEASALLEAMREGEDGGGDRVTPTDLVSPDRVLREAVGRADAAVKLIGEDLRDELIKLVSRSFGVEAIPAVVISREELFAEVDDATLFRGLSHQRRRYGTAIVSADLSALILEASLGAPEDAEPTKRPLSALEECILEPVPRAIATALTHHFIQDMGFDVVAYSREDDAKVAFEPMLRMGVRFVGPNGPVGEVHVGLSPAALDRDQRADPKAPARPGASRRRLAERISLAEVDIAAMLGRLSGSVGQVLRLKEGDLLRLDGSPEQPIALVVDEIAVAVGTPIVHRGNIAVEITERY